MLRHLQICAGIVLIIAGVLGTLLPVIPGIPLLIAGAALLGAEHPLIRPFAKRFERWRNRNKDDRSDGDSNESNKSEQDQSDGKR